jgi:hypothetical protein
MISLFINSQISQRVLNTLIGFSFNISILIYVYYISSGSYISDFAISLLLFQYIFNLIEWGFNLYAIDRIKTLKSLENRNFLINQILISKVLVGLFGISLFSAFFYFNIFTITSNLFFYSTLFMILMSSLNPLWLYQSTQRIGFFNKHLVIYKVVQFVFLFYSLHFSNLYIFFISQGVVFFLSFLSSLYFLHSNISYIFKFRLKYITNSFLLLRKTFSYFLSNLYNNINLTIWGFAVILLNITNEIVLFNIIETLWRSVNTVLQSIIEPSFRNFQFSIYNLKNLFTIIILLLVSYQFIEIFSSALFPLYSLKLIPIFKVLFFVFIFFTINKIITFFVIGRRKISTMNKFNLVSFFIYLVFFGIWLFLSNHTIFEILIYLLIFNIIKLFIFFYFIIFFNGKNYLSG